MKTWILPAALFLGCPLTGAGAWEEPTPGSDPSGAAIRIVSPRMGSAVFGDTTIRTEIAVPPEQVDRVEFLIDELLVDTRFDPPFEIRFDFGKDTRGHRIEVRLHLDGVKEPLSDRIHTRDFAFLERVVVRKKALREHRFQFLVRGPGGIPVRDLEMDDFQVTIAGRECVDARGLTERYLREGEDAGPGLEAMKRSECDITYFANPEQTRDRPKVLAVVVDISGSVAPRNPDGSLPLERLLELSSYVREGLAQVFDPDDRYFFARFAGVMHDEGPTGDTSVLGRILLRPYHPDWGSGTPYYSTAKFLTDRLKTFPESPKAILMFSDCRPYDKVQATLDRLPREIDDSLSPRVQRELRLVKQRLLEERTRMMEDALDFSLEVGVPVYNVHYPDENFDLAAEGRAECHRWVLRTGGNIFYLGSPESDIGKYLRMIEEEIDSAYLIGVRHERAAAAPKVRVRGRLDWKVVTPKEFQSFESAATLLTVKLTRGTPEERLEAAHFARRYADEEVRVALRGRLERETYGIIKETIADSLFAISLSEVCAGERTRRGRALGDLILLYPTLDRSEKQLLLGYDPETCIRYPEFSGALLHWWGEETIPAIRGTLYSLSLDAIRYDLEHGRVSAGLGRAGELGGRGVEVLLRQILEGSDLAPGDRRKVSRALQDL